MNKKQLLEKKNELIEKMESILSSVELEQRAISDVEDTDYKALEVELRELNQIILDDEKKENLGGNLNMEKREFAQNLLRGEVRADSTTHSNAIPTNIAEEIIEKISEHSTVVADATVVNAMGKLEFLVEKETVLAEVLGETDDVTETDLELFDKVVLDDKRVGTLAVVSKRLLMNAPAVGVDYVINTLAKRVALLMEREMFTGDGTEKKFGKGLLKGKKVALKVANTITVEDLMNLVTDINPVFLNGAKMYMNRNTFKAIAQLKQDDKFIVVRDIISDKPVYTCLGSPIEITESIEGLQVVLADVANAMKLKVGENVTVQVLQEKYATKGSIGVLAEFYGDSSVTNEDAVRVLA